MNKKQKRELDLILGVLLASVGAFFWYKFFSNNWILFFVFIIIGKLIPTFILKFIPDAPTSKSKKTTSKKTTKKQQQGKIASNANKTIDVPHNRQLPDDEILQLSLEEMSWREFERLCFLYYKAKGYKPRETQSGPDGGVDLIYYHPYHKSEVAVQIKHRIKSGNDIDVKLIRELNTSKRNHKCFLAEFISTGGYTTTALAEAGDRKIECHDLAWVEKNIVKWKDQEAKKKKLVHA